MAVQVKVTLKGVRETFRGLDQETTKLVNSAQRIAAFQSIADLQFKTPVDQGRARSSWLLTKSSGQVFDSGTGRQPTAPLGPIPNTTIESLYITNGTPYIQDLNAGSSLQAPPRFIETTVSKYFRTKGNFVKII
jgi:hypothetical protein